MLHRACSTEQGCSWLIQLSLSQKHFLDLKRINQKKFLHRHLLYRYFDLKFFIDSYPNFDEIDHYRQQSMKIFVIWFFQTGSHYVAWGHGTHFVKQAGLKLTERSTCPYLWVLELVDHVSHTAKISLEMRLAWDLKQNYLWS